MQRLVTGPKGSVFHANPNPVFVRCAGPTSLCDVKYHEIPRDDDDDPDEDDDDDDNDKDEEDDDDRMIVMECGLRCGNRRSSL